MVRLERFNKDTTLLNLKKQLALRYQAALKNVDMIQTEDLYAKRSMALYKEDREVAYSKFKKGRVCDICGKNHFLSN